MTLFKLLNMVPLTVGIIMLINNDWIAETWIRKNIFNSLKGSRAVIRKRVIFIAVIIILLSLYKMFLW